MGNLKTILTLIAVILGIVLALAVIGTVITALQYLFWLGVICLAAVVTVKLLRKSDSAQLESKDHLKALKDAERSFEEYRRKYLPK